MAINLSKGQTINLDKGGNDLSSITIGLGWKIKKKPGFFARLLSKGDEFDLDAIAFMLDANGKIQNLGYDNPPLRGSDVIFFNNLRHSSGTVVHTGDNLVGGKGVQDDEQIIVKLTKLPAEIHKLLFIVCIYEGNKKRQHFGEVEGAFMRAVDAKGNEIARYRLDESPEYNNMCTMVFGEVYRKDGGWKFRAIGDPYPTDNFAQMLKQHLPG